LRFGLRPNPIALRQADIPAEPLYASLDLAADGRERDPTQEPNMATGFLTGVGFGLGIIGALALTAWLGTLVLWAIDTLRRR
jgi:hypothetical protein